MISPTNPTERKAAAKELLLGDHRYFAELFLRNEQIGETRVNWFIGIVTGAAGALVALTTKGGLPGGVLRLAVFAALIALLVFGLVTLFRIFQRNRTSDGFKKDLDNVRQVFRDHFDPELLLMDYQPFGSRKKKGILPPWIRKHLNLRRFGGLVYTVAAINSLLAAALAAAIVYPTGSPLPPTDDLTGRLAPVSLRVFVLSFAGQWLLIIWREWSSKRELRAGGVTHAGGVVFTRNPNDFTVKYLIIPPKAKANDKGKIEDKADEATPSKGRAEDGENHAESARRDNREETGVPSPPIPEKKTDKWVLPKGHVKDREHHAETALREVLEETGVRARVIRLIGTVEYETIEDGPVKVKYYLMEMLFKEDSAEERESQWFPHTTAVGQLSHPQSKHILKLAEELRWRELL